MGVCKRARLASPSLWLTTQMAQKKASRSSLDMQKVSMISEEYCWFIEVLVPEVNLHFGLMAPYRFGQDTRIRLSHVRTSAFVQNLDVYVGIVNCASNIEISQFRRGWFEYKSIALLDMYLYRVLHTRGPTLCIPHARHNWSATDTVANSGRHVAA